MNPELDNLRELIELLRETGVRRYRCGSLDVELGDQAPVATAHEPERTTRQSERMREAESRAAAVDSPYGHPSLKLEKGFPGSRP